jgi:hypothetical protein
MTATVCLVDRSHAKTEKRFATLPSTPEAAPSPGLVACDSRHRAVGLCRRDLVPTKKVGLPEPLDYGHTGTVRR